ncbi:MCM-domain-containing protein [Fragilariopsis cylindrus CCMP1102]|uniref:DNA replication licensing factor MCM5 n=1 Tax=Fragilariopsis cylindrus CCMP1102 TaxID=635003 RepID=A0A1E7FTF8_9STRA|nr:MCM-domain-containing protein [Fragilariopsis cylindrus CCMP1102]|eukprot:OEU21385.1 MCM-domain-containing protein [Fragilariopsis cylindrus CCMP1102]
MLEIDVAHLGEYDPSLLGYLRESPSTILPELEIASGHALDTLLYDLTQSTTNTGTATQGDEDNNDNNNNNNNNGDGNNSNNNNNNSNSNSSATTDWSIQILLKGNLATTPLRQIQSQHIHKLIKCPGIVISATPVQCRAVKLVVRCNRCMDTQTVASVDGPYGSVPLPPRCQGIEPKECGPFPYSIVADESIFSDRQKLKLQEAPEKVPTGEMPRSVMVAVEKGLVDKAPPGTRVALFCVPTLFGGGGQSAVQKVYLRCVGMSKDHPSGENARFTPAEEEAFGQFARRRDAYEILTRSIAPSIQGSYTVDIKKALVCMLMGGTRKRLPDGMRLRGDINVLLLGDPSTAKSQFLKFVGKASPVGIYTSGKGSSAAGLTASVVKNAQGEFYLEGGAMVLADGGIVCIDEFDKMRPQDRVAIHEAMEQQTISIAKAGITTVLNSRSAVLAAANPVFGRYDDFKSASENIDLMTTILSRFDMIFLVRDIREEERDLMICRHVMGVHIPIAENMMRVATTGQGDLDVPTMKKYIQYCKSRCKPTLSEEAGQVLTSSYVKIRDDVRKSILRSQGEDAQATIPITVRQLEALVRISESLAKLRLDSEVRIEDVNEALRLFRVSTMAANSTDQTNGMAGGAGGQSILSGAGANNREEFDRAQGFLRCRLAIGSTVNKQKLIEEGSGQGYNFMTMVRVLSAMAQRGEILERNQGRLLKRVK